MIQMVNTSCLENMTTKNGSQHVRSHRVRNYWWNS